MRAVPVQLEAMRAEAKSQVREAFEECMQGAIERVLEKIDASRFTTRTKVNNLSPRTHEEARLPNSDSGDAENQNARGQKRKRALLEEEIYTPINDNQALEPSTSSSASASATLLLNQHLQRRRSSIQVQNSTRHSLHS